jgi:hypothetical protein
MGEDTVINNRSVSISEYRVNWPVQSVIDFYHQHATAAWITSRQQQNIVLGAAWHGGFLTVELTPDGAARTDVRTSFIHIAQPVPKPDWLEWPPPPRAQLLLRSSNRDGCREADLTVWQTRDSAGASREHLERRLRARGYHLTSRSVVRERALAGEVLWFQNGTSQWQFVLTDSAGMHWMRATHMRDLP